MDKLSSILVGIVINFVVLSLVVYFGISLFSFILTTTGSVSEKMGTTLEREVNVLATVCLSDVTEWAQHGDILTRVKKLDHNTEDHVEGNMITQSLLNLHDVIDRRGTEHGKTPTQMDFKGEKETKESSEHEMTQYITLCWRKCTEWWGNDEEIKCNNSITVMYKQTEETRLNQDIQISILRHEIKALRTNPVKVWWVMKFDYFMFFLNKKIRTPRNCTMGGPGWWT